MKARKLLKNILKKIKENLKDFNSVTIKGIYLACFLHWVTIYNGLLTKQE
jgi:hypothetical protein